MGYIPLHEDGWYTTASWLEAYPKAFFFEDLKSRISGRGFVMKEKINLKMKEFHVKKSWQEAVLIHGLLSQLFTKPTLYHLHLPAPALLWLIEADFLEQEQAGFKPMAAGWKLGKHF